ncbi:MAG: GerW family sporulation protein [Clostridia bacterium]|nr:GerW family sporulation protein [Clostridia bacterium]
MKGIFENNKSIENLIENTMKNLNGMIEANTIIGEPIISPDGTIIIPFSKVSVGYVVGGGEFCNNPKRKNQENFPLAGGSGGGMTITPVGFLVENQNGVEFIDIENTNAYQSVLKIFNKIVDNLCGEKSNEKNNKK